MRDGEIEGIHGRGRGKRGDEGDGSRPREEDGRQRKRVRN